jgi:hypothetical protein
MANALLIMIFLSFQVFAFAENSFKLIYSTFMVTPIIYYLLKFLKIKIYLKKISSLLILSSVLATIYLEYDIILALFFLTVGYLILVHNKNLLDPSIGIFIYLNTVIMILQITGKFPAFNSYQFYYPGVDPEQYVSLLKEDIHFAPMNQWRPSGIFPSTIYLSMCQLFTLAYLHLRDTRVNNLRNCTLALMFAISGSTFTLVITVLTLILSSNRKASNAFALFYAFWMTIYILILPDYFIDRNYSLHDFFRSFIVRLYVSEGALTNAAIVHYVIEIIFVCSLFIIFSLFIKAANFRLTLFVIILLLSPIMLHNVLGSMSYWFFCGIILYLYNNNECVEGKVLNKI